MHRRADAYARVAVGKPRDEIIVRDLDLATFIVTRTFRSVVSAALKACPEKLASGVIEDELTGFAMRYLTGKS